MAHHHAVSNWDLPQAEKIELERISNKGWSEAAKFTEQRLNALTKISETLLKEEDPFVQKERGFLERSIKFLENFSKASQEFIRQEEENIRRIRDEIQKHRPEEERQDAITGEIKRALNSIEAEMQHVNEQQKDLSQKKKVLADTIDPAELSTIKFKDFLDTSNDIFKWCIQAVYKESKANYEWGNFKKQVFIKDKGADFILRLKGLSLQKLKKDDFVFAKVVVDKKNEILADLEPKGKENASLRHYFDYLEVVVRSGDLHDKFENLKQQLEEKQKELEKKSTEGTKAHNIIKVLEEKINVSTHYINTLNKLKPQLSSFITMTKERIDLQDQYVQGLRGNLKAMEAFQYQAKQSDVKHEQEVHHPEPVKEVVYYETHQHTNKGDEERAQEEHFEGGEQAFSQPHKKIVESKNTNPAIAATDLKESEFASSNRGSCESCGMF